MAQNGPATAEADTKAQRALKTPLPGDPGRTPRVRVPRVQEWSWRCWWGCSVGPQDVNVPWDSLQYQTVRAGRTEGGETFLTRAKAKKTIQVVFSSIKYAFLAGLFHERRTWGYNGPGVTTGTPALWNCISRPGSETLHFFFWVSPSLQLKDIYPCGPYQGYDVMVGRPHRTFQLLLTWLSSKNRYTKVLVWI